MIHIINRRRIFYIISGILIIPGLLSLLFNGLKLGIDFTGGSRSEYANVKNISKEELSSIVSKSAKVLTIQETERDTYLVRTEPIEQKTNSKILAELQKKDKGIKEASFETVGPTIGSEITRKAFIAVLVASLAITLYIAYTFREVSKPLASWKYGVAAVGALLHDVFLIIGVFSILGWLFNVEVDALFITALLTIMGFSVHDTIVVFDRIRENLKKELGMPFEEIVNVSVVETFNRSLNTSLTVLIVLFTLLIFSGEGIRWFVVALFVGILSGTYSSIFNASPLLVTWNAWDQKRKRKIKK